MSQDNILVWQMWVHNYVNLVPYFTCSLSWIEILGTLYEFISTTCVLHLQGHCGGQFSFSHYFVLEVLHTICFSSHQHAHEVSRSTPRLFELVQLSDLYDHSIASVYTNPRCHSFFVPLKYYPNEKV